MIDYAIVGKTANAGLTLTFDDVYANRINCPGRAYSKTGDFNGDGKTRFL